MYTNSDLEFSGVNYSAIHFSLNSSKHPLLVLYQKPFPDLQRSSMSCFFLSIFFLHLSRYEHCIHCTSAWPETKLVIMQLYLLSEMPLNQPFRKPSVQSPVV